METACWFIKSYFYTDKLLSPEFIHKSCRYAHIHPLIVDVKFVVPGFICKLHINPGTTNFTSTIKGYSKYWSYV